METNLKLYIDNSREIYCTTEWLANCVAKKMAKGQEVTIEHLANSSSMKDIIRYAKQLINKYGEKMPSKEECKEVAYLHAEYIINDFAPCLIEEYKPKTRKAVKKSAAMYQNANVIFEDYTETNTIEEKQVRKTA